MTQSNSPFTRKAHSLLDNIVIVLVEPQNPANIGGVVRAMMNMGLSQLRLVRPKRYDPAIISAAAHRSEDFQKTIRFYDTLSEALADVNLTVAASNRRRRLSPHSLTSPELAPLILEHSQLGKPAILFGREDWGLPNDVVERSDYQVYIPTNPDYASLNLAQAVLIIAYDIWRTANAGRGRELNTLDPKDPPASEAEFKAALDALLHVLDRTGFFKPGQEPAKRVKVERLLRRTHPTSGEAGLLRAIAYVLDRQCRDFHSKD